MNAIGVNIIGNKTFRNCAEELLTRNSQFIHQLMTELSTLADQHVHKIKRDIDRKKVIHQYETLIRCLILGYRTGVEGTEPYWQSAGIPGCEQTVNYLSGPYATLGYQTACRQIELMIERGHHRSQTKVSPARQKELGEQYTEETPPEAL
jgi:hypothetical protein